ncbi:hypothetical protein PGTUg99_036935 [Puccinia graminis f. sp. tritici]|uniref:Uncharacterized protein n=1 Tax=Puccinia graminis f. sp. tritici TaxID=56615 RepID=A0A5B0S2F3_PUCGR|nr:hypothetical protein PGTUg99_036935 [Puccinia graminis f. sp. tritici]
MLTLAPSPSSRGFAELQYRGKWDSLDCSLTAINQIIMLDHETRPNKSSDLIIKLLNSITNRYRRIDVYDDGSEPPEDLDDETVWVHDNWRYARAEALSIGEINDLNALLLQMENIVLPLLQQQLSEMLESLNLDGLSAKVPSPNLFYDPAIVFRLGHTVDQIAHFVQSIAPIVVDPLHSYKKNDHDYGGLKFYRTADLIEKVNDLIHQHVQTLIDHHVRFIRARSNYHQIGFYNESELILQSRNLIKATAQTSKVIDRIIKWSKKSDFSMIQDDCLRFAKDLDPVLEELTRRIFLQTRLEKRRKSIDEGHTNRLRAERENEHEDIGPHSNSNNPQDNQSNTRRLTDSFEEISAAPQLIQLAKTTVPIIKILRIFFNKLSNTSITKAPFTMSTRLCSNELNPMDYEICSLDCGIKNLLNTMYKLHDSPMEADQVRYLQSSVDDLGAHLDASLTLLSFHLVPLSEICYANLINLLVINPLL